MDLNTEQQVFLVFYAISWGTIANVQPKWKPFHWPLIFEVRQARSRLWHSFLHLNVFPIFFFAYALWSVGVVGSGSPCHSSIAVLHIVIHGVIPAFAVFGFYRLWLGRMELHPERYYETNPAKLPQKYRIGEPTYRPIANVKSKCPSKYPTVDMTPDAAWGNILAAIIYIGIAAIAPWIDFWHICLLFE